METTLDELKELSVITDNKLNLIEKELTKYSGLYYKFLEVEAINKIRRFGKIYYKDLYLKNPQGNVSAFMTSYLYLKHTESQLKQLQTVILSDKEIIEEEIRKIEDEQLRHK